MNDEAEYELWWKRHEMVVAVATAALELLNEIAPDLRGPLPFVELEKFRREVERAYETLFLPDNARPPRPRLRLVSGD